MSTYNPAGGGTYYLNSSISSTDTTITLSSFLEPISGVPYTMSLLNTDIAYATIGPRTTSSEFISFTGITQNADDTATLTGVTRGLAKKYPFTESSVFKLPHAGQSVFILSDAPQVLKKLVSLENDETISGVKTFTTPPISTVTPTAPTQVPNKAYVDLVAGGTAIYDQNIIAATAGETLAAGNLVYFKPSDQRWYLADTDVLASVVATKLGFAQGTATAGNSVNILIAGLQKGLSGLTAGSRYYVSATAGGIETNDSTTISARNRFVGWASSTTQLMFSPDDLDENLVVGVAGEILTAGQWVYFKVSDSKWYLTDSDAAATTLGVQIGICQIAAGMNTGTLIRIAGFDISQTGLTSGSSYYLSGTAGAISTTPGTFSRFVGVASGTTRFLMSPGTNVYAVNQNGQEIYGASSGGTDAYAITLTPALPAYQVGQVFRFKADVGNTGGATLNINGLGALTILTSAGSAVQTGDITANQIVEVSVYDGSNVKMLSPTSNLPLGIYKNGTTTKDASDASTTQNIAHGLGTTPKFVTIYAAMLDAGNAGQTRTANTVYNGTTQSSLSFYNAGGGTFTSATTFTLNTANANATQTGVVTWDSTNIIITWTKSGSPTGVYTLVWTAQA